MLDLKDFEPGPLSRVEGAQHRLLWSKHIFGYEQRKAWVLWLKIAGGLVTLVSTGSGLWAAFHGTTL